MEGKNRKKSLVYHILDRKKGQNYELLIHTVCRNSILSALDRKKLSALDLDRKKTLKELLNEFHDLTFEDQMSKLEFYCTQFGLYTSDKEASDFGKVPEPSLSEIQEFQSASFLSFREVLNY